MPDPAFDEATTEKILRNIFTLGFGKPTPTYPPYAPTAPRLNLDERIRDAGKASAAMTLDLGAAEGILTRLNAGGGATFNSIDDGLQHALGDGNRRPGLTPEERARHIASLQGLSPSEFLFQFRRLGLGIGDFPGFMPDLTDPFVVDFIDEFARRVDLQQITRDGRLVQPIGPITTLPVAPPPRSLPVGFPAAPPAGFVPGLGDGGPSPPPQSAPAAGRPPVGLPPGFVPGLGDGRGRPAAPIGPGLDTIITIGDGIASGTARAVDKRGNGQVPPDGLRPPVPGSGGTGRPPGFGQAFPDPLFQRNPPDP